MKNNEKTLKNPLKNMNFNKIFKKNKTQSKKQINKINYKRQENLLKKTAIFSKKSLLIFLLVLGLGVLAA